MTIRSLEITIEEKIQDAKAKCREKYFKLFISSTTVEERELLHAKISVLDDLTFALINTIREK